METKKMLEESLERLRKINDEHRSKIYHLDLKVEKIEREKSMAEHNEEMVQSRLDRANKETQIIINILAGDSSFQSKGEVISDLFFIQIKIKKKENKEIIDKVRGGGVGETY